MMPSCDQTGVPLHFHSSTTSGSASLMSLRILPRVFPRQSPSSAILLEMSPDADWPWLAPDFFMFSSRRRRSSASRDALPLAVELHRGSPEGEMRRRLQLLDERGGAGRGPQLAAFGRGLVHVSEDDRRRPDELVHRV